MNIDGKILNKISAKWNQQHIRRSCIRHNDQVFFSRDIRMVQYLSINKCNIAHKKNHMIFSINQKKTVEKLTSFLVKRMCHDLIKVIYKNL
jgi:hypothetical protein